MEGGHNKKEEELLRVLRSKDPATERFCLGDYVRQSKEADKHTNKLTRHEAKRKRELWLKMGAPSEQEAQAQFERAQKEQRKEEKRRKREEEKRKAKEAKKLAKRQKKSQTSQNTAHESDDASNPMKLSKFVNNSDDDSTSAGHNKKARKKSGKKTHHHSDNDDPHSDSHATEESDLDWGKKPETVVERQAPKRDQIRSAHSSHIAGGVENPAFFLALQQQHHLFQMQQLQMQQLQMQQQQSSAFGTGTGPVFSHATSHHAMPPERLAQLLALRQSIELRLVQQQQQQQQQSQPPSGHAENETCVQGAGGQPLVDIEKVKQEILRKLACVPQQATSETSDNPTDTNRIVTTQTHVHADT